MPAIFAEIDVEDLGTEKVREFRDALSDLLDVQQRMASAGNSLAGGLSGGTSALGAVSAAARAATSDLYEVADALQSVATAQQQVAQDVGTVSRIRDDVDAMSALAREAGAVESHVLAASAALAAVPAPANLTALVEQLTAVTGVVSEAVLGLSELSRIPPAKPVPPAVEQSLASVQQQAASTEGALAEITTQASAAQAAMARLAATPPPPPLPPPPTAFASAITELVQLVGQANEAIAAEADQLRVYAAGLGLLADAATSGRVPLEAQARAVDELAAAASTGVRGLGEFEGVLRAYADQLRQGKPLTDQQRESLLDMGGALAEANRETLGLGTATQQLITQQQAAATSAQQTVAGFAALAAQLQEGATVSQRHKDALTELTDAAEAIPGLSAAARAALAAMNAELRVGGQVTPEFAAQLSRFRDELARATGETRTHQTAVETLLSQYRAAQAELQQVASAFRVLSEQLTAGATVSRLQAEALQELAQAAQTLKGATDEDRQAIAALVEELRAGAQVTPELASRLQTVTERMADLAGASRESRTAVEELIAQQRESEAVLRQTAEGLRLLSNQFREGSAATQLQRDALQELTTTVQGLGSVADSDKAALQALNEQIQAGATLTPAMIAEFTRLSGVLDEAAGAAQAHATAIEQVIAQHRASQAQVQQAATAFQILADQLQEGASVTQLQRSAFQELADTAGQLSGVTDEDREAIRALNAEIQNASTITPELAARIRDVEDALAAAAGATREDVSAIQELIKAEQQAMQASRERAEAAAILERELQEGAEVTATHKRALEELNRSMQESGKFTESTRQTMEGLTYALDIGHRVSGRHAAAMGVVAQATREVDKSTDGASKTMESFRASTAVAATAFAALAAGAYSFLRASGDISARVEVIGTAMEVVAKNANLSTLEMNAQEQRIKSLGITTAAARQAVLDFVQAELDMADAAKIARAAQDLAVIGNLNSSESFSRLTTAIQIQQPRLLRQFGIMTTLDQIYREYALTVGKTVQQLNTLDKRQAFINKILEAGEKAAGAYEAAMNDVGKQMGSMARLTEEARRAIGDGLLPVMRLLVGSASELLKWFTSLRPETQQLVTGFLTAAAAASTLAGVVAGARFLGILKILQGVWQSVLKVRDAYLAASIAAKATQLALPFETGAVAATTMSTRVYALRTAVLALWGVIKAHPIGLGITAVGLLAGAFVALGEKGRQTADSLRDKYGEVLSRINQTREEAERLAQLAQRVEETGVLPGQLGPGRPGAESDLRIHQQAAEDYARALQKAKDAGNDLTPVLDKVTGKYIANADAIEAANKKHEEEAETIRQETIKAYTDAQRELDNIRAELDKLKQQTDRTAEGWVAAAERAGILTGTLLATNTAVRENTSVWSDLWTLLKNAVMLAWLGLKQVLADIWELLMRFPELLRTVGEAIQKTPLLPPQLRQLGTILQWLGETGLPRTRAEIGALAQASEQLRREMDPGYVKDYEAALRAAAKTLGVEVDELRRAVDEMDRGKTAAELLQKAQDDARKSVGLALGAQADIAAQTSKLIKAGAGDLVEFLNTLDLNLAKKLKLVDPGAAAVDVRTVKAALAQIEELLGDYGKAQEAARKKAEAEAKKHREAIASFLGVDENLVQGLTALDAALGQAAGDQDLYNAVVLRGTKLLDQYAVLTQEQKEQFRDLANVIDAAVIPTNQRWEASLQSAIAQTTELIRAVEEASREIVATMGEESMELFDQLREQRITSQREVNNQIRDLDQELFEQQVVAYRSQVDQAIYQEQRRVEAIERQIQDEIRARNQAQDAAESALERRVAAHQRELDMLFERIRVQRELQRIELEAAVIQAQGNEAALREAETRLLAFDRATTMMKGRLDDLRQLRQQQINEAAAEDRAELAKARRHNEQLTALQLDALERIQAGAQANIAEIRRAYDEIRKLGLTIFDNVVTGFLQGLARMAEGTASFKDVLLGIWRSIQSALFGFFEQMVKRWIADLLRMQAAQRAANLGAAGGVNPNTNVAGANPLGGGGLLGQGLTAAGIGGLVGFGVGSQFNSRLTGGLAGAASGAATGAMIGAMAGPLTAAVGAVIGGIAGLIGGIFGGGKEAREVAKVREQFLEAKGGVDALRDAAEEAGVSIERMLTVDSRREFEYEIKKVEDALKLREAKEGIARTYSELVNVRRQVQLVGGDLQKLYNARTIEEFNREQQRLNELLEAQQRRLAGLGRAAEGLAVRLAGEAMTIQRAFEDLLPDEEDLQEFFEAFTEARKRGFRGDISEFAREERTEFDFDEEDLERVQQIVAQTQETLDRLTLSVHATFAGVLQETGDIVQAMNAVTPILDQIIELQDRLGITASESLKPLLEFRQVIKDHEDLATSLSGLTQMVLGFADANRLTQDLFSTFGRDAVAIFEQLEDRGVSTNNILLLMQPTLQALWEAQREFGFQTDDATQKLLDQAEAAGIVGLQQQDINKKILDVLVIIAQTLGADIPAAYVAMGQAAADAGSRARGELDATGQAIRRGRDEIDIYNSRLRDSGQAAADGQARARDELDQTRQSWNNAEREAGQYNETVKEAARIADESLGAVRHYYRQTSEAIGASTDDVATFNQQLRDSGGAAEEGQGTLRRELRDSEEAAAAQKAIIDELTRAYEEGGRQAEIAQILAQMALLDTGGTLHKLHGQVKLYNDALRGSGDAALDGQADVRDAFEGVEDAIGGVIRRTKEAADEFEDFARTARDAGDDAEDAMTHVAEGRSPTGIKQIVLRLQEAIAYTQDLRRTFLTDAALMERAAARAAEEMAMRPPAAREEALRHEILGLEQLQRGENGVEKAVPEPTQTVVVNLDSKADFKVEGTKATAREEWERLKPVVEHFLENNTKQLASKIGTAAQRYPRRRG